MVRKTLIQREFSLDFSDRRPHASAMYVLLLILAVQALNLVTFLWIRRPTVLRMLVLLQQLSVYKRSAKKPRLNNRNRLFWSVVSRVWKEWRSELILVNPETVIR